MDTTEAIHGWRSIRRYKDVPVPREALKAVLSAGRRAPSWENVQPWHFIVADDAELKGKLAELASSQKFVARAPVVIAVCGDLSAWEKPKNKAALMELVEAGAMKVTEEIIDEVILTDPVFSVVENGPAVILSRTFEQLGIAYGFMGVEAVNQGLGMCIVGALNSEVTGTRQELYQEVKDLMAIPKDMYLLTLLTLGVPGEEPKARPRKAFESIVSKGKFGNPF
jgi:nitroreductase